MVPVNGTPDGEAVPPTGCDSSHSGSIDTDIDIEIDRATSARRGAWAIIAVGGIVLVVHNVLVAVGISEVSTVLVNIGLATGMAVVARRAGLRALRRDLGFAFSRRGWIVAALAGSAAGLIALGAAVAGALPVDLVIGQLAPIDVFFRVLIAIPIGTALCEELIFRGVLLAAFERVTAPRSAIGAVSILFGLWHVAAETSRTGALSMAVLPGVIATAAVSAFVLCPLRRYSGDLIAPIAVHATTNVAIFVAVFMASRTLG